MGDIVGIVLGAGASSRLGRPKQLLAFGDTTLLGHVVRDVESSRELDRVVVVVVDTASAVAGSIAPTTRAELAGNAGYGDGCAASLLAGLDTAGECDAIVLLLGDMPGVTADLIDGVVAEWRRSRPWAAVTRYRDGIGHPFVFSSAAFPELRALHGDKAVWKIVDREPEERVARLSVATDLPRDVDTWDDYVTICAAFGFDPEPRGAEAEHEVYPRP